MRDSQDCVDFMNATKSNRWLLWGGRNDYADRENIDDHNAYTGMVNGSTQVTLPDEANYPWNKKKKKKKRKEGK